MNNELVGGSFNLRYGRPQAKVKSEVTNLLKKHKMDFLCVQEATDYTATLSQIDGYNYFVDRTSGKGSNECGILVNAVHTVDRFRAPRPGNGWFRRGGKTHARVVQPTVRINKEWHIRSFHIPSSSDWVNGKLKMADNKRDDVIASVLSIKRFLSWPGKAARLAAGDANEKPSTKGRWSPTWLEIKSGATIYAPRSRAGHGRIDWAIAKNCRVLRIVKDTKIVEGSDHEPVVFVVRKS